MASPGSSPTSAAAPAQDSRACTDLLTGLHLARRTIQVPAPVVAEVGHLLARTGGAKIEAAFLRSIVAQTVTIVDLELADYERIAELVETYADFPSAPPTQQSLPSRNAWISPRSPRSIAATSTPSGPETRTPSPCCPDPSTQDDSARLAAPQQHTLRTRT